MTGLVNATLQSVCILVTDGTHDTPKVLSKGIPFIKAKQIANGTIDFADCEFISHEEHLKVISRSKPEKGDTLFAHIGATLGATAYVNTSMEFSIKNVALFKPNPNIVDSRYLYYLIRSDGFQKSIKNYRTGSAQPFVSLDILRNQPIKYHNKLGTQRKIAAILAAYDDLIENNTRRIKILEEMAQAIYREWFVHYRFPGHEKVKLVDSGTELGMVPEGWEVKPFSKLVEINPAVSIEKQTVKPFVGMNALSTNTMVIDLNLIEYRTGNSGAKFQNRDVLFPRITPSVENGKAGFVQFLGDGQHAIGSTEIIVFREKEINAEYIHFLTRDSNFRENAIKSMVGASGRQRVQNACFDSFLVVKPANELLNLFYEQVTSQFTLIHSLTLKNQNLQVTRDLLLPKLISGELDVSEMEIEAGEINHATNQ